MVLFVMHQLHVGCMVIFVGLRFHFFFELSFNVGVYVQYATCVQNLVRSQEFQAEKRGFFRMYS